LTGRSAPINQLPFIIGRGGDANLCITSDNLLSRQQCVIDWEDGAYVLRDSGSRNGTWLNGRRLRDQSEVLQFGSVIRFSPTTVLTFVSLDLPDLPDLTGCLVGERFKLVELIRSSKKSALYRADDQRLPQSVAVKVLSPKLATYPGYREQFNREAETAARMQHPNITKVLDFGISKLKIEGQPEFQAQYVCSDFMKGGDLATRIAERKFLRPAEVAAWLVPIAEALHHAHEQGVVHSGLKATSVVFDGGLKPYLTDFAVATYSNSTERFSLLGAPDYMAPEQWEGSAPTPYTDQYSLAVLAYYSLCGLRPYEGQLDPEVRAHNFQRGPLPVHQEAERNGNAGVSPGISEVLLQALALKPQSRYPTTRDFSSAFTGSLVQVRGSTEPNIFLSYRRDCSAAWVTLFARELKHAGMKVIVDVTRQDNALVFPAWLENAISKCDVFVCFLSKRTLTSKWVCEEIRIAHRYGKLMIPIFQEDFKPPKFLAPSDNSIETLLTYQGVHLLDRRNIYVEAAVGNLATMIQASIRVDV
jgi:serine/threonine protein kinase